MNNALLRIYQPQDRTDWPRGWPTQVGVMCLWVEGRMRGVCPFHESEAVEGAVRRILDEIGVSDREPHCFPYVAGFDEAEITQDEEYKISDTLSLRLHRTSEDLEAANDFAVNFEYAHSEGLALEELAKSTSDDHTDALPIDAINDLPGYLPFEEETFSDVFEGAYFLGLPRGQTSIVFPEMSTDDVSMGVDPLISIDGTNVAIEILQLMAEDAPPRTLRLPLGCLPHLAKHEGQRTEAIVVRRGEYLIATPLGVPTPTKATSPKVAKKGKSLFRQFVTRLLMVAVLLGVTFGSIYIASESLSEAPEVTVSSTSTETLKGMLFQNEVSSSTP
jgi:hypothetical protein